MPARPSSACWLSRPASVLRHWRRRWCELLLGRHVAERHLVEHRRQYVSEKPELADLPYLKCQRQRDRFLGPAESHEPFDATPLVDRVEGFACRVFHHGAHRTIVVRRLIDENLNFLKASGDGLAHAAMAGIDDVAVTAILFGFDHWRLDNTDGLDGGQK